MTTSSEALTGKLERLEAIEAELADIDKRRPALIKERMTLRAELRPALTSLLGRAPRVKAPPKPAKTA